MHRGRLAVAGFALLAALEAGCVVSIRHVNDPQAAFRAARVEAERYQGRPGPAHRINVLVFDPEERKLVRVSLPLWLARKLERHVDLGDLGDEGGRAMERSVGRKVARRIHVDDLDDAGLGLLADVEDDDGHVLVWLR
jgi:hypothetical protein